jgi:Grx4 family monothiol glutaredoxin
MQQVENSAALDSVLSAHGNVILYFWASWSEACRDMDAVLEAIQVEYGSMIHVVGVEAEKVTDVSLKYSVKAVPLCVLVKGGQVVEQVQGMDAIELQDKLRSVFLQQSGSSGRVEEPVQTLDERLDALIQQSKVMLFMKGSPDAPKCGFSQKAVNALRESGCNDFGSFDILEDQEVRQGLKEKSKWPTYPQLYVNGELLGGCDIILEMFEDGSLASEVA